MAFYTPEESHIHDALLHLSQGVAAESIPIQAPKNTKPLLLFAASKGCGRIAHEIAAKYAKSKGYDFGLTLANGYEWDDLDEDDAPKETKRYKPAGLPVGGYAVFQTVPNGKTSKIEEGIIAGTLIMPTGKRTVNMTSALDTEAGHGLPTATNHAFFKPLPSGVALG